MLELPFLQYTDVAENLLLKNTDLRLTTRYYTLDRSYLAKDCIFIITFLTHMLANQLQLLEV